MRRNDNDANRDSKICQKFSLQCAEHYVTTVANSIFLYTSHLVFRFTWLLVQGLRSLCCRFRFVHFSVAPARGVRSSGHYFTCIQHAD